MGVFIFRIRLSLVLKREVLTLWQWHIPEDLDLKENTAVTKPGQVKHLP
jgi:hypothetical protein